MSDLAKSRLLLRTVNLTAESHHNPMYDGKFIYIDAHYSFDDKRWIWDGRFGPSTIPNNMWIQGRFPVLRDIGEAHRENLIFLNNYFNKSRLYTVLRN